MTENESGVRCEEVDGGIVCTAEVLSPKGAAACTLKLTEGPDGRSIAQTVRCIGDDELQETAGKIAKTKLESIISGGI